MLATGPRSETGKIGLALTKVAIRGLIPSCFFWCGTQTCLRASVGLGTEGKEMSLSVGSPNVILDDACGEKDGEYRLA